MDTVEEFKLNWKSLESYEVFSVNSFSLIPLVRIMDKRSLAASSVTSPYIQGSLPGPNYGGGNENNGDLPQKIPKKKKCKKAKWLSEEALQRAVKRREAKSKGKKEIYPFECRVPQRKER